MATTLPLPKLTRPRLFGTAPRERLYALLEQRLAHPAVWIVGRPGAGKTTLAASFREARGRPALWCQVDGNVVYTIEIGPVLVR